MLDQFQQSLFKGEFINQSNKSNQISHEAKNGSEVIFYNLICNVAFKTFHVFDAFVAFAVFVVFVVFVQQH